MSPELALVDPELAAELRAALPENPWPAVPRLTVERAAPAPARHRSPFLGSFIALGLVVVAVTVLTVIPRPDRPTFAATVDETAIPPQQQPPPLTRPRAPKVVRTVTRPALTVRTARAPGLTAETQPRPRRPGSTLQRARRSTRPAARARVTHGPTLLTRGPSFAWPPHATADYYDARFFRNGRAIYHARTRVPRVRVPTRIRFTAGVYRWIVRPMFVFGLRAKLGTPIVDATFRIDGD